MAPIKNSRQVRTYASGRWCSPDPIR